MLIVSLLLVISNFSFKWKSDEKKSPRYCFLCRALLLFFSRGHLIENTGVQKQLIENTDTINSFPHMVQLTSPPIDHVDQHAEALTKHHDVGLGLCNHIILDFFDWCFQILRCLMWTCWKVQWMLHCLSCIHCGAFMASSWKLNKW